MINFHAVMIGEDGMEFGAEVSASSLAEAMELLREDYPESRVDQLESPSDISRREDTLRRMIDDGADFDENGNPFYPHGRDDFGMEDDEW